MPNCKNFVHKVGWHDKTWREHLSFWLRVLYAMVSSLSSFISLCIQRATNEKIGGNEQFSRDSRCSGAVHITSCSSKAKLPGESLCQSNIWLWSYVSLVKRCDTIDIIHTIKITNVHTKFYHTNLYCGQNFYNSLLLKMQNWDN